MTQKVVEFYMDTLKHYTKKLNKDKVIILMQVGEFFEVYGLIYPDGRKEGNIWEFCDNVNLKVAHKPQEVYNNPAIQVFMGGVGESYINPYIQKAVDRFGWTVVIFEQSRVGNGSAKFERKETSIISPGLNINSDSSTFSNITMIIYIEQVKTYYKSRQEQDGLANTNLKTIRNDLRNDHRNDRQINIGMSFIDCISGANGIMAINNSSTSDISIPFDELLKLLTIKNPNELYIYIQNYDSISDEDLINALHLFNYQFKIIRDTIDDKYSNLQYQSKILDSIYKKHRGILDILQQLDIEGPEHNYSRIALNLLLEFVINHDKTIIEKLEKPEIMLNSDKYLMLANNCLEQLDIIDNMKAEEARKSSAKRISLLDLLDNTKTPLGKILLRQRLSIPITSCDILESRYKMINELETLHNSYMSVGNASKDKYGSPLHQLRLCLTGLKNIDNYLRKIITQKIQPLDISSYLESLEKCCKVYEFVKNMVEATGQSIQSKIQSLLPNDEIYATFTKLCNTFKTDINLDALQNANVWSAIESNPFNKGVSSKLDELQSEIDNDKGFLDSLILELSKIVDPKYNSATSKSVIFIGENASKGIHIYTNKARKDILEAHFAKPNTSTIIGNYQLTKKDIKYTQLKESKWEIEIVYLKTSNGTLRANIERMGRFAKSEFIIWLQNKVISCGGEDGEDSNDNSCIDSLTQMSRFISEIDILQSNVCNAVEKGYTMPILSNGDTTETRSFMKAENLRHPIIEHIMTTTKYVPNDVSMGIDGTDGILLFGVNAVGKSSLMKSIGINIIMAQAGMYVASSKFVYKPYKYLFTRIRNNDNLYAGLSSFEVEMKEFKVILKYANEDSIILGDELASGTETQDATALVASGIGLLAKRKCSFIFATHLHFLADMHYIKDLSNVKLCHMAVELDPTNNKKLVYSRKIHNGSGPKSYGILVCESMDLDYDFIVKAKEIRESMNTHNTTPHNTTPHNTTLQIANASIGSKYNSEKIISMCEVCNINIACDVHHINQQCDANHNNLIDNPEYGIFNKNKLWNLVALCKECHQCVHNSPSQLEIKGYVSTSVGTELKYKWLKNDNTIHNTNTINNENELKSKNGNSINSSIDTLSIIRQTIIEMKKAKHTPKKIQFDLQRYYNVNMTQQKIREYV